jgi:hypothetical protein
MVMAYRKLIYPEHGEPDFSKRLGEMEEYQMFKAPSNKVINNIEEFENNVVNSCTKFEKTIYQNLVAHYLSRRSPYKSILLYHSLGVGKTCSSITAAESLLIDHTASQPPPILVVSSAVLRKSFEEQIFALSKLISDFEPKAFQNQCTADVYLKLVHGHKNDPEILKKRINSLIKSRYRFVTYDGLIDFNNKNPKITDTLIIVDEVHNLRIDKKEKEASDALEQILIKGERNRLLLLSATPMYNEPDEIFWLLSLLLKNDKRSDISLGKKTLYNKNNTENVATFKILSELSSEYISYIRSGNPFIFATRISPQLSKIECIKDEWAKNIDEGIVYTELGSSQNVKFKIGEGQENVGLGIGTLLELSNITYPNKLGGRKGFSSLFNRNGEDEPIQVTYKTEYENSLSPDSDSLKKMSAKLEKIGNIIKNSEGIIVIYSQFVWSGVIPVAVMLEHMGFKRYGNRNILHNGRTVSNSVKYTGIPFPNYCILSSDPVVMGQANQIDKLIKVLNSKSNIHGEQIKVVLMTPVAGEGLSFRNIREMHILDPWYHMNRIEQVIGRGIRQCSHIDLPVEERNVTIFLHASGEADIHAYKIATRKLEQTIRVDRFIRDNALDCNLLYNVNYYSKENFKFNIVMRTSQKSLIQYKYGSELKYEPKCVVKLSDKFDNRTIRKETIHSLSEISLRKMKNYILSNINKNYIDIDELIKVIGSTEEVAIETIYKAIYPNILIPNKKLYIHMGNLVIIPDKQIEKAINIKIPEVKEEIIEVVEESEVTDNIDSILDAIPLESVNDKYIGTIAAYSIIDSNIWFNIAKKLINEVNKDSTIYRAGLYANIGALIKKQELPRHPTKLNQKYIGFVNVFNTKEFEVILMQEDNYRHATEAEIRQIKMNRTEVLKPTGSEIYSILEPQKSSKVKSAPYRFIFKIVIPEQGKNGEVCESKKIAQLKSIMEKLNIDNGNNKKTKDQYCYTIMYNMMKQNKLYTYPVWKPKV